MCLLLCVRASSSLVAFAAVSWRPTPGVLLGVGHALAHRGEHIYSGMALESEGSRGFRGSYFVFSKGRLTRKVFGRMAGSTMLLD